MYRMEINVVESDEAKFPVGTHLEFFTVPRPWWLRAWRWLTTRRIPDDAVFTYTRPTRIWTGGELETSIGIVSLTRASERASLYALNWRR